ncbi:hypothetical protein [Mesorhizobium erdmanii]|uniref:hypothetical protein n=1 Tax=Mesorhizobium erdmanii TaxID=1777866 RepID=UPI00047BD91B|nr:hypothetical protein [Mesorhizobium erdmanii]
MKALSAIFILAALVISAPAWADDRMYKFCEDEAIIAGSIMTARQRGMSLGEMMRFVHQRQKMVELRETQVMMAWEEPRYETEIQRQRAVADFRDMVQLNCLKAQKQRRKK